MPVGLGVFLLLGALRRLRWALDVRGLPLGRVSAAGCSLGGLSLLLHASTLLLYTFALLLVALLLLIALLLQVRLITLLLLHARALLLGLIALLLL